MKLSLFRVMETPSNLQVLCGTFQTVWRCHNNTNRYYLPIFITNNYGTFKNVSMVSDVNYHGTL